MPLIGYDKDYTDATQICVYEFFLCPHINKRFIVGYGVFYNFSLHDFQL